MIDQLLAANWQRSGGKGRRPKPVLLPGDIDPSKATMGASRPAAEARDLLDNWSDRVTPIDEAPARVY